MTTSPTASNQIPPTPTPRKDRPMVVFAIADLPGTKEGRPSDVAPVTWTVSQPHPILGKETTITRMISVDNGLEVYSTGRDPNTGHQFWSRTFIPTHCIRVVQEVMSYDVYVNELHAAEMDDDDDDDEDEFEDEPQPNVIPTANGQ